MATVFSTAKRLGKVLRRLDFSVDTLATILSPGALACMDKGDIAAAQLCVRRLIDEAAPTQHVAAVAGMFMFGMSCPRNIIADALGEDLVCELLENGVLDEGVPPCGSAVAGGSPPAGDGAPVGDSAARTLPGDGAPAGDNLSARFDVRPINLGDRDIYVASDWGMDVSGKPLDGDYVLGVGGASLSLLNLIPRNPVESTLDLGCGCGIQALYMSTFATKVVASDISDRAIFFTTFNAHINDIDTIEVVKGSFFEPLAHRKFDLIATNPPFVITPPQLRDDLEYTYRDGGMAADQVLQTVVSVAPQFLRPGGRLIMLGNWVQNEGGAPATADMPADKEPAAPADNTPPADAATDPPPADTADTPPAAAPDTTPPAAAPDTAWAKRVSDWLAPTQMRWLIARRDWLTAEEYVHMWLKDSGQDKLPRREYLDLFQRWCEGLHRDGITEVAFGFLAGYRLADDAPTEIGLADVMDSPDVTYDQVFSALEAVGEH